MTDSNPSNENLTLRQPTGRGRRWLFVALPVLLLGGALGAQAYAFGGRGRDFSPEQMEKMMDRRVEHLLDKVDATADQRTRIKTALSRLKPEMKALHDERTKLRDAGKKALAADPINASEVERLRREAIQLADRTSTSVSRALVEVAGVLNVEQRKELLQLMENHHRGWH